MHTVMLDLEGLTLSPEEKELIQHPQVGGIIFFARNYESPAQIHELIQQIRKASPKKHLLLAVDQEGGRVQRFINGFTHLPPLGVIGQQYRAHPKQAIRLAQTHAWLMASELLAVGIDISFAPVLDLNKKVSEVIGDRAFSSNPETVSVLAKAYVEGMQRAGMAATGKHFPGHGSIRADSHIAIPIDKRSFSVISQEDLQPFIQLVSAGLQGIMPAHIIYPDVDEVPAGFSAQWLQKILRQRLGFNGMIFSDDLSMEGASQMGDYSDRARAALTAGCDMVLICNNRSAAIQIVDNLQRNPLPRNLHSPKRLQYMFGHPTLTRSELMQTLQWQQAVETLARLRDTIADSH